MEINRNIATSSFYDAFQFTDITGLAHKGQGNIINLLTQAELQIIFVFFGQAWCCDSGTGKVYPFTVFEGTAKLDFTLNVFAAG